MVLKQVYTISCYIDYLGIKEPLKSSHLLKCTQKFFLSLTIGSILYIQSQISENKGKSRGFLLGGILLVHSRLICKSSFEYQNLSFFKYLNGLKLLQMLKGSERDKCPRRKALWSYIFD